MTVHVTRDYSLIARRGNGRELIHVEDAEDFPDDRTEGTVWKTPEGWYQLLGEFWTPIYEPHHDGALEAINNATAGNIECESVSWGSGCPGAHLDVEGFLDDLTEAGWRVVRAPALDDHGTPAEGQGHAPGGES